MDTLKGVVDRHASAEVSAYCLYMYYFCSMSFIKLSAQFHKSPTTISEWVSNYEAGKGFTRKETDDVNAKFSTEMKEWEAKTEFIKMYGISISKSRISLILKEAEMSWKCLERRAIQVCYADVARFTRELYSIAWMHCNLVFLDEVSFDNRCMLRRKGFGLKGSRLYYLGEYVRKPRISMLSFIGVGGVLETFQVEGTFDRLTFTDCCKKFAPSGKVKQYPGDNSVWILDGASIHRDENLAYFIRSLGIIVIFLPAYCPFFNPIEVIFGQVKGKMQLYYEQVPLSFELCVVNVMSTFQGKDFSGIFRKCGYDSNKFDPAVGLQQTIEDMGFNNGE
ncbi:hypothetical protein MP638_000179 [Amoeboaphelidium occidentale]|nr:hypothetical protein MP638_000179 [Amoeboaphelidium occidentale]